jgi:signal peptidase I
MKKVSKWLGITTSILIYSFLALMVLLVVQSKMNGGQGEIMGYRLLSVLSGSMEPGIKTGSIIAIKPNVDIEDLKKGDVITFKSEEDPNKLITHRITDIKMENSIPQFITKGDNNDAEDPLPVRASNVVGKYSDFTVPFIGQLLDFIKSKTGAIYLLIVPGVLLIVASIISIWKAISELDKQKKVTSV